jgi:hypothetical protein
VSDEPREQPLWEALLVVIVSTAAFLALVWFLAQPVGWAVGELVERLRDGYAEGSS